MNDPYCFRSGLNIPKGPVYTDPNHIYWGNEPNFWNQNIRHYGLIPPIGVPYHQSYLHPHFSTISPSPFPYQFPPPYESSCNNSYYPPISPYTSITAINTTNPPQQPMPIQNSECYDCNLGKHIELKQHNKDSHETQIMKQSNSKNNEQILQCDEINEDEDENEGTKDTQDKNLIIEFDKTGELCPGFTLSRNRDNCPRRISYRGWLFSHHNKHSSEMTEYYRCLNRNPETGKICGQLLIVSLLQKRVVGFAKGEEHHCPPTLELKLRKEELYAQYKTLLKNITEANPAAKFVDVLASFNRMRRQSNIEFTNVSESKIRRWYQELSTKNTIVNHIQIPDSLKFITFDDSEITEKVQQFIMIFQTLPFDCIGMVCKEQKELAEYAKYVMFDGTFSVAPSNYKQLLVIHGYIPRFKSYCPLFYALLPSKDQAVYNYILSQVNELVKFKSCQKMLSDFEKGLLNSVKSLCHHYECGYIGCRFHYAKAICKNFNQLVLSNKKTRDTFNNWRNNRVKRSLRDIEKLKDQSRESIRKAQILSAKIQKLDFDSIVTQSEDFEVNQSDLPDEEHQSNSTKKEPVKLKNKKRKQAEIANQTPRKRGRPPKHHAPEDKLFEGIQSPKAKSQNHFTPLTKDIPNLAEIEKDRFNLHQILKQVFIGFPVLSEEQRFTIYYQLLYLDHEADDFLEYFFKNWEYGGAYDVTDWNDSERNKGDDFNTQCAIESFNNVLKRYIPENPSLHDHIAGLQEATKFYITKLYTNGEKILENNKNVINNNSLENFLKICEDDDLKFSNQRDAESVMKLFEEYVKKCPKLVRKRPIKMKGKSAKVNLKRLLK